MDIWTLPSQNRHIVDLQLYQLNLLKPLLIEKKFLWTEKDEIQNVGCSGHKMGKAIIYLRDYTVPAIFLFQATKADCSTNLQSNVPSIVPSYHILFPYWFWSTSFPRWYNNVGLLSSLILNICQKQFQNIICNPFKIFSSASILSLMILLVSLSSLNGKTLLEWTLKT